MADDAGRLNQVFAETSFLYGANAAYIEELHEKWANDPASVSGEWKTFFDQLRDNAASVKASADAGSWGRGVATEPTEETGVFDGRWPAPKPDPKKPGAAAPAAAAKAVWGENQSQKEPVSGVQGDTAKGEPYDAGNLGKLSTLNTP